MSDLRVPSDVTGWFSYGVVSKRISTTKWLEYLQTCILLMVGFHSAEYEYVYVYDTVD